ncbi:MAG: hypothetical protein H6555_04635 [Lewinellaceae bacterium]|nr:hypothetical protein [Lewinellaceae bacterium]
MMLSQVLLLFTHATVLFALTTYFLMVARNQGISATNRTARVIVYGVIIAWIPTYMGFLNFFFEPFQWGYYPQKLTAAGITMLVFFITWWVYRKQYGPTKHDR